jgi:hypothetical protein
MQQFELGFESQLYFLFHDFDPNELCMINGLLIGGRGSLCHELSAFSTNTTAFCLGIIILMFA